MSGSCVFLEMRAPAAWAGLFIAPRGLAQKLAFFAVILKGFRVFFATSRKNYR